MDAAAATARGALTEMRAMLGVLREGAPDASLKPMEPVAPEATIAAAQRAGYPATLAVSGAPALSDPVRFAVGRIVQEGVTNRSDARRVGTECVSTVSSRWSPDHNKKKKTQ